MRYALRVSARDGVEEGEAAWPERLLALAAKLHAPSRVRERQQVQHELWDLLNLVLQIYVRRQARTQASLSVADMRDIAAAKASELFLRLDSKEWSPAASPPQLRAFLAMVARNGVVDFHRRRSRDVPMEEVTELDETSPQPSPETLAHAAAYARAILDCAGTLTTRARRAWLLRVLYELDSHEIARDPGVASTGAGVDTMLARCRAQMRSCLDQRGLILQALPPGTFARLWTMTQDEWKG